MSHRTRVVSLSALLFAAFLAGLLVPSCRGPGRLAPDWTPRRLHEALEAEGLDYEGLDNDGPPDVRPIRGNPGYYLRRRGCPHSWEVLAMDDRRNPASWRGALVVLVSPFQSLETDLGQGRATVGHFTLLGDPEELKRVADALR